MERRDFLKYILAAGACVCSGCNIKNTSNAELNIIKFSLCYHCNLNCAYCNHFSPIAPKYELPYNVFKKDIKQLYKLTKGKIKYFEFMGGEPLLNKDIEKIISIASDYFPTTQKTIVTNGLLLKNMPKSFYKTCINNDVQISISNYPKSKEEQSKILKIKSKYDNIIYIMEEVKEFAFINLSKKSPIKPCDTFECPHLDNGILAPCTIISNIKFFNSYFKEYSLPVYNKDYLNIYKISSIDEIINFLNTPKLFCTHCGYAHKRKYYPWKISEKKFSEWYNI